MKRPFLALWPKPGRWRVAGGRYWPIEPMPVLRLVCLPGGRLELA